MKNLLTNWKTTSAGLGMIAGAIIHLVFAVSAGHADENTWTTAVLAVIGGIGLIAAGDAAVSATKTDVAAAIQTGDTTHLTKPDAGQADKPQPK